ncbi:MAG: PilZ domain-containing protein [Pseudomonadota bacterium]
MTHAPDYSERRAHPRVAANFRARAFYGTNNGLWADCHIVDVSQGGARLKIAQIYPLPGRFMLLQLDGGIVYEARLRWRRGDLSGVAFDGRHDVATSSLDSLALIRQTWDALQTAK